MLIAGFPAGPLAANCYVLAPAAGSGCVVVDPGQAAAERLARVLAEHRLRPRAVLLTHGHLDHVASARVVCDEYRIPAFLHDADRYMLDDPLAALSPELRAGITALLQPGDDLDALRPAEVEHPGAGSVLDLAGLSITVMHTPGHTGGSVVYRLDGEGGPAGDGIPGGDGTAGGGVSGRGVSGRGVSGGDGSEVLLTGDTLFAGSIGRTDLPGGSSPLILESIAAQLLTRPDAAIVLPGHGPTSTVGAERAGNPFLAGLG